MKVNIDRMKTKIRIGTRSSALSVAQTKLVAEAMKQKFPQVEIEIICRKTVGDKILDKPLLAFGGKGVFVSEFEEALLAEDIDFAVHSAKDLPLELAEGLEIVGAFARGDVRDVLVMMKGEEIHRVRRIGTSSLRRKVQLEDMAAAGQLRKEVVVENLRGNVLSRLKRLEEGRYDGIVLAAAGLERLGLLDERDGNYEFHYFTAQEMIPAGGQGILVIEGRKGEEINRIAEAVSDPGAMRQFLTEREVLHRLNAGCHAPVGVYCERLEDGRKGRLSGIYEKDGKRRRAVLTFIMDGEDEEAAKRAAKDLANQLLGGE